MVSRDRPYMPCPVHGAAEPGRLLNQLGPGDSFGADCDRSHRSDETCRNAPSGPPAGRD